jgi:hypothetical protein
MSACTILWYKFCAFTLGPVHGLKIHRKPTVVNCELERAMEGPAAEASLIELDEDCLGVLFSRFEPKYRSVGH